MRALDQLRTYVDTCEQDWPTFTRQAAQFHLRNAGAWANAATGEELSRQIDPEFVMGPALALRQPVP